MGYWLPIISNICPLSVWLLLNSRGRYRKGRYGGWQGQEKITVKVVL